MSQITNLNSYQYQQNINVSVSGSKEPLSGAREQDTATRREFTLHNGDIIQGEIIGTEGNQVKLMLNGGTVLQAHVEQEIQMLLGQKIIFSVRGGGDSQVSLNPLFENMAKQETAGTALREAGMMVNDANLKLVSMLMQEGMSIDKNMLAQLSRQISLYPEASIEELVQMNKLGLPVSAENIVQFQQYRQNNHQLLQSISDVVEQLPDSYMQLVQQGNASGAKEMLLQILQTFEERVIPKEGMDDMSGVSETLETIPDAATDGTVVNGIDKDAQNSVKLPAGEVPEENGKTQKAAITADLPITQENSEKTGLSAEVMETEVTKPQEDITLKLPLTKPEMKELLQQLKNLGIPEETLQQLKNGQMDSGQIIGSIRQQLQPSKAQSMETIQQLLKSPVFKKVLQDAIGKQWLLKPEELTQEKGVIRFYEKLERQTRQLLDGIEQEHMEQTPFARTIQNMHANINFMNDMNHMFTYIQLPLKLTQSNANSELYVYTNKKSLAKRGGDISALLHLDMDHIGVLDVRIVLHNSERVSTDFKVQDEEILDLLDAHMDELNKRLADKGYSMSSNVHISEVDQPVMQEILQDNKSSVPVAMYTFDARA